jgi:hypothetical protein
VFVLHLRKHRVKSIDVDAKTGLFTGILIDDELEALRLVEACFEPITCGREMTWNMNKFKS